MSRGGRRGVPPDLKGTLGTLIRTTINQVGAMTDVARRQARSQKQRLDTALLERRRRDALAELGEILYQLVSSGEIELEELPELTRAVKEVAEIDRRIADAAEADAPQGEARSAVRQWRTAGARPEGRATRGRSRVWRPDPEADSESALRTATRKEHSATDTEPEIEPLVEDRRADRHQERAGSDRDAARSAAPPRARSTDADRQSTHRGNSEGESNASPVSPVASPGRPADGGGGIVFLDDDSAPAEVDPDDRLESYMNEDDVPRRR